MHRADGDRVWLPGYLLLTASWPALSEWLSAREVGGAITAAGLGLSIAALGVVLSRVLAHWGLRRRVWLTHPERLVEPPPKNAVFDAITMLLAIAGAALVAPALGSWTAVLALALAGLALLGVFHRGGPRAAGVVGMCAIGLTIFAFGGACGFDGRAGRLLSAGVAAGYLLWLAGFWRQQLLDGRPWTTTGRLIPVAHRLSIAVAVLLPLAAWRWGDSAGEASAAWATPSLASLALLALALLHRRSATEAMAAGTLASICCLFAAAEPLAQVLAPAKLNESAWRIALAFGGLLLAARAALERRPCGSRLIQTTYVCVIVPALLIWRWVVAADGAAADGIAFTAAGAAVVVWLVGPWRRMAAPGGANHSGASPGELRGCETTKPHSPRRPSKSGLG